MRNTTVDPLTFVMEKLQLEHWRHIKNIESYIISVLRLWVQRQS